MGNYAQKLANMRSRRLGLDAGLSLGKSIEFSERAALRESYESRTSAEATKYALGAMQALEAKYTTISVQEGNRVRDQLKTGLATQGISVEFEYQGSVPLDIHIRFASDIDLLVLHTAFFTYDGTPAGRPAYTPWRGSILNEMLTLRRTSEMVLEQRFPAVKVDKSGSKSISLSGGSLQRKVDVVPSHWHNTIAYETSGAKHDREVRILDRNEQKLISNRPFLHIQRIDEKDRATNGGAKKVIRLLKNLRRDSSKKIELTSYDIASLVWHFDANALNKPYYLDLSLVAEAQRHLQFYVENPAVAKALETPDRSRKIIDSIEKQSGLMGLKLELDELASDIANELAPALYYGSDAMRKSLMEAQIF